MDTEGSMTGAGPRADHGVHCAASTTLPSHAAVSHAGAPGWRSATHVAAEPLAAPVLMPGAELVVPPALLMLMPLCGRRGADLGCAWDVGTCLTTLKCLLRLVWRYGGDTAAPGAAAELRASGAGAAMLPPAAVAAIFPIFAAATSGTHACAKSAGGGVLSPMAADRLPEGGAYPYGLRSHDENVMRQ